MDMIGTTHVCNVKSLSLPQVRLGLQIIAVRAARNSLLGPQFIAVRAARESDPSPQVTSSRARCSARGGGGGTRVARHEQLKCIVLRAFSAGHSRGRTQRAAARPARERGVSSFLASAAFCLLSPLDPVGDAGSARQQRVPRQWHREPSWLT